jgi:hypothetical protein
MCRYREVGEVSDRGVDDQKGPHHADLVESTPPAGARHDLTDEQWAILVPLLPVGKKPGRPRRWTLRQLIDGTSPDPVDGLWAPSVPSPLGCSGPLRSTS